MQTTVSTRFDADMLTRLDEAANAMDRSRSALIKEAVSRYLDYLVWYQGEVERGAADLAAGRVRTQAQVKDRVRGLGFHVD